MTRRLPSPLEEELLGQIRLLGLPTPWRQFRFALPIRRQWRADFVYPAQGLLIEIEGGIYECKDKDGGRTRGRHVRPKGFEQDCEKYNYATILGWKVLRFTAKMIRSGHAISMIQQALSAPGIAPPAGER